MRNAHADDAAVLAKIADIRDSFKGLRDPAVYAGNAHDHGLIPAELAAEKLGIELKRLLGFGLRNEVGDPIGGVIDGQVYFYDWSLEPLRKRLRAAADQPTVAP